MRYMIQPNDKVFQIIWMNKESGRTHEGPPLFVQKEIKTPERPTGEIVKVPMPLGTVKRRIKYATAYWTRATYSFGEAPKNIVKKFVESGGAL